jgi:hypothetical protein
VPFVEAYKQPLFAFTWTLEKLLRHVTLCDLYSLLGKMALGEFTPIASECKPLSSVMIGLDKLRLATRL